VSLVVADASPLIGLAKIDHLHLLSSLFGIVTIPGAVYTELVVKGAGLPGSEAIARAKWLQARTVTDRIQIDFLRADLDIGEAEAIVLAQEVGANPFLVDETRARTAAKLLDIPHIGTAGILILAKRRGHIVQIAPLLDALRARKFFLSDRLVRLILEQAGE
jgi:uncharacterized protein